MSNHVPTPPARACGEEAGGEAQHRTQVNSWAGLPGRVSVQRNVTPEVQRWPGEYWERVRRDIWRPYPVRSPRVQGSCEMPGRTEGGNDDRSMPVEKSDLLIVAMKPVKAGGAKGEME